jgi:hypothetical protein
MTPCLHVSWPALLGTLSIGLCAAAGAAELQFDAALAASPPAVAHVTIEALAKPTAAGNAVLRLRFQDERRDKPVVIDGGSGPALLRDDGKLPDDKPGDGSYAAYVRVDAAAMTKEQARRFAQAGRIKSLPVFHLRELLRFDPFKPPPPKKFEPGVIVPIGGAGGLPGLVDAERELLIRDVMVVDDPARTYNPCLGVGTPMGAWTFGRLMTEIANKDLTGIDPADLTEHWIRQWESTLTINDFSVRQRAIGARRMLVRWPRDRLGKLDLAQAPFRLLAIVYGGGDAGEARLVFGALNCGPTELLFPEAQQFTVIFEYGVPRSGCAQVRHWARQWHALGGLTLGSPEYNAALQAITDQFTLRDANPARPPNRSAINQVRTNEIALFGTPTDTAWELRESKLRVEGAAAGLLEHGTVAQTPDVGLQTTLALDTFINENTPAILSGRHVVPLRYPAALPFLGGNAPNSGAVHWVGSHVIDAEAGRLFALATCSGCHGNQTRTSFLHIAPRSYGMQSSLSNFMTGDSGSFHELLDRQMKLDLTANMSCTSPADFAPEELFFRPLAPMFRH